MPRYCPTCQKNLEASEIVKGYSVGDNQFVLMEAADFANLPLKSLKSIEVLEFVESSGIDPRHQNKSYFLAPEEAGAKAFNLFLQAMEKVGMVGVVKLCYRDREHLATIRALGKIILLQTLYYTDELRSAADVEVSLPAVSDRELGMAMTLIRTLVSDEVDISKYRNEYRDALMEVIQAKLSGEVIQVKTEEKVPVMDLVDALMASIEAKQQEKVAAGVEEA